MKMNRKIIDRRLTSLNKNFFLLSNILLYNYDCNRILKIKTDKEYKDTWIYEHLMTYFNWSFGSKSFCVDMIYIIRVDNEYF